VFKRLCADVIYAPRTLQDIKEIASSYRYELHTRQTNELREKDRCIGNWYKHFVTCTFCIIIRCTLVSIYIIILLFFIWYCTPCYKVYTLYQWFLNAFLWWHEYYISSVKSQACTIFIYGTSQ